VLVDPNSAVAQSPLAASLFPTPDFTPQVPPEPPHHLAVTLLTYGGGGLIVAGALGLLTSGVLQGISGQPGGTCNYNGQLLFGSDCATDFSTAYKAGYGASAGAIVLGAALLGGGLYVKHRVAKASAR
jgi:hypothetical protein